jgi:hypothetical protein
VAEQTPLYMDISGVYSGDEIGLPNRDLVAEGIVGSTSLAVTAHGGANSVDVAAGACWVTGDTDVNHQPTYRVYNDATVNLGISPDPTNPRIVLVVAQVNDATFVGVNRNWQLVAIHGTPAGSPAVPATPASALPLARILVPAAAASSAAYTITDMRVSYGIGAAATYIPYTPTITGSTSGGTVGNGTLAGVRYIKMGKLVHYTGQITLGSTTSFGTGNMQVSLPINVGASANLDPLGFGWCYDVSTTNMYLVRVVAVGTSNLSLAYWGAFNATQAIIAAAAPVVWTTGDIIAWNTTYESA